MRNGPARAGLCDVTTIRTRGLHSMTQTIATVVIPAAGRGTRLLPATKTTPKELLNIYDRPALQFAIDEALDLGAARIVLVIHPDKAGIRHYLTPDRAYVSDLRASGKAGLGAALAEIDIPDRIEVRYVEQPEPLGLGHAVLCARALTLKGPFGVILPDDVILNAACLPEMAAHYIGGHMIAAMDVRSEDTGSYGIFRLARPSIGRCVPVTGMVEKPGPGLAPSRLAAVGRYILDPGIFDTLGRIPRGAGGEIQLTDAIVASGASLTAFRFRGTRHDCGSHDGLIDASLARQAQVKAGRAAAAFASSGQDAASRD